MPELPEVESFKRYFENTSLNKKIVDIECPARDLIKGISFSRFRKVLIGRSFRGALRRGKFLIIEVNGAVHKLIIHFGMTGGFYYAEKGTAGGGRERFGRLIFRFKNGAVLYWLNMRKFGRVYLVKDPRRIKLLRQMGPEPLTLSEAGFLKLLEGRPRKNIKAFLLDQRDIAGIGNLYSDEILFRTRTDPRRKIITLNSDRRRQIYKAMLRILKRAIEVVSASEEFAPSWLISHRGEDMHCPRDRGHPLKREIIAGRWAIYCPLCQK